METIPEKTGEDGGEEELDAMDEDWVKIVMSHSENEKLFSTLIEL